jgi:phosphoenolpyruvate-protein phosphotransferase
MTPANTPSSLHLKGIAAAPGLAAGPAAIWQEETLVIPRRTDADPAAEARRLEAAREGVRLDLERLRLKIASEASAEEAAIFEAHALILSDTSLLRRSQASIEKKTNAEAAWDEAVEFFAAQLAGLPDPTLSARAADVRDVGRRVVRKLMGRGDEAGVRLAQPSVVVARDLAPSQTAGLRRDRVLAFLTAEGGPTSHTAILARALGLPAVVGLGKAALSLPEGTALLVDGGLGEVIAGPSESEARAFQARGEAEGERAREDLAHASEPAVTLDGHRVEVAANVGSPEDAATALRNGAEGIGLLRTEFLYLDRRNEPTEAEQLAAYDSILDVMERRPVVARTLDVGGDKELPYLDLGREANPFLGWRAIRMCLDCPDLFTAQLRALLRAGAGHDLRIMFPMIATLEEVRAARKSLEEARRALGAERMAHAETVQVGIMVEVPSVAVLADLFAKEVDFFSIGTNDLTQYTLAAERTNDRVAHLSDALHPAVIRQIARVIEAGHERGIWVGVCGELAGDVEGIPILLGLGLDEFSMAAPLIPRAKAILRRWSLAGARRLAEAALKLDTAPGVRALVQTTPPG